LGEREVPLFDNLVRLLQLVQIVVQTIESGLPDSAERLQPVVQLLKRLGAQPINTPIGNRLDFNEAGFAKHAEMLGGLGLLKMQSVGDLSDGARTVSE
jgi:hypothetical protein